jgi:hypothetical protein
MMKRYIKTPLKYALPLLFIRSLVLVSISGCTSSNNTTTATPTATASASSTNKAGFDPLLAKMEPTLKAEYGNKMVNRLPKNANQTSDELAVAIESNGTITTVNIRNDGTTDQASRDFKALSTPDSTDGLAPGSVIHFGLQAATVAFGHAPSAVNDAYLKGGWRRLRRR